MADNWPSKGSKMYNILEAINELSTQCPGGRVPITEVHMKFKKNSKESIRTMISQLKRKGYIDTPIRGSYVLTKRSKKLLLESTSNEK